MLQKEFFQVQPFNPNPYWDPVIVNLTGASKFEQNTIFAPGQYKIEVAPGGYVISSDPNTLHTERAAYLITTTIMEEPFQIRAYCGSNGSINGVGTNPYSGPFKVNGILTNTQAAGINVNHIFGAGGGNAHTSSGTYYTDARGGGNCLGNGSISYTSFNGITYYYGAGSCLHFLPVGGTFGTDYLRAYHYAPVAHICGGAYGGGAAGYIGSSGSNWGYKGGDSPYGTGGNTTNAPGNGIGGGGKVIYDEGNPRYMAGGAFFNGTTWYDSNGQLDNTVTSIIRVTYLGPLFS